MDVNLFDFALPEAQIALRPLADREQAKLLHVTEDGALEDRHLRDLPELLRAGDVLVFNNTKVIPARLQGVRERGSQRASFQATLHKQHTKSSWYAFVRPARRLQEGDHVVFSRGDQQLRAIVREKNAQEGILFAFEEQAEALHASIAAVGTMPLPPYVASRREQDAQDFKDYQTVFAEKEGAVAAPTAGLHYTADLLNRLKAKGVEIVFLTLHVGAGTFLPVKVADTKDHKMHGEKGILSLDAALQLNKARREGRRIIAVGTTALRLLETVASAEGFFEAWEGETRIFITPGYKFRAVDCLLTNFHLPRSTLFMLVCAFCGLDSMQKAYAHAIAQGYRFYSYGDTSLLERQDR